MLEITDSLMGGLPWPGRIYMVVFTASSVSMAPTDEGLYKPRR